jgi:hypothetical protein
MFLSVGRVAAEKNLPYFLDLELPGSKLVAVHRLCVSAIGGWSVGTNNVI